MRIPNASGGDSTDLDEPPTDHQDAFREYLAAVGAKEKIRSTKGDAVFFDSCGLSAAEEKPSDRQGCCNDDCRKEYFLRTWRHCHMNDGDDVQHDQEQL